LQRHPLPEVGFQPLRERYSGKPDPLSIGFWKLDFKSSGWCPKTDQKELDNYDAGSNSFGSGGTTMYYNAFSYDANGNIESQLRQNHAGTTIDDLTYHYHDLAGKRLRNRLYGVNDPTSGGTFTDDIDDMGAFDTAQATIATNNNYGYDAEGRLVRDDQEEIEQIVWRVDGKVKNIIRPASSSKKNVSFDYEKKRSF